MTIDLTALAVLHQIRAHHASMVTFYGDVEQKVRQNEALVAAGLTPIYSPSSLKWDQDQAAKHRGFVETLDAVIAQLGGDAAEAA